MRMVKGKALKSIVMAKLFNKEQGDCFVTYLKGMTNTANLLEQREGSLYAYVDQPTPLDKMVEQVMNHFGTEKQVSLFVDGNFSLEVDTFFKRLEKQYPNLKITISVQTENTAIAIEEV